MLADVSAGRTGHKSLEMLFEHSPGFMAVLEGADYRIAVADNAFVDMVGPSAQIGARLADALPGFTSEGIDKILERAARTGQQYEGRSKPLSVERPNGSIEEILVDLVVQPLGQDEGPDPGLFIHGTNVTEGQRNEALRLAHNQVLELAISDAPLETTLAELIRMVESTSQTGVLGSILLLDPDGKHLRMGAAPSLPAAYSAILSGVEIGNAHGSCGTAAYLAAAVFVSDIAKDPLWAKFKHIALAHGLRACWSTPIMTRGRKVLGTFAMYHREPRQPTARDMMLVELVSQTAALLIDREQAKSALDDMLALHARASEPALMQH